MQEQYTKYQSPLTTRYTSSAMSELFSANYRYTLWRKLWIALAEGEKELGLPITRVQIDEMKDHLSPIDYDRVTEHEKVLRHDVMAHIHAWGEQCPLARPIIHLGATSCYVTDNSDLIIIREALDLVRKKLALTIKQLSTFAEEQKNLACLGFTHYQPAQLTTIGKRACLWIQDLMMDLKELEEKSKSLLFLGVKGTTGTQASFLSLFQGNHDHVKRLDMYVAKKMGFDKVFPISGQTYTRKLDTLILKAISGVGESCHKFATDLRLMANLKEMEEPFEKKQVGSSAMPYKRNPMLSERICSLSRFLISLTENCSYTHATQWLERTLDDSANKRITVAEAFLTADAILNLMIRVTNDLVVYPQVIQKRIEQELPFMATENILMQCVKNGGDRQELHEKIRQHSLEASKRIKEEGKENDLLERIANDPIFKLSSKDLTSLLNTTDFIGRAPQQVEEYLHHHVFSTLDKYELTTPSQLCHAPEV